MRYFDAHTHPNFAAYDVDRDAVMERAGELGVGMNVVGTQRDTAASAIALAQQYDDVYATIGLHPVHTHKSHHDAAELGGEGKAFTSRGEEFDEAVYLPMAQHPKVIAIGECGLDYYHCDESSKKKQHDVFVQHIELAHKVHKPLMLHVRAAYDDAYSILKSFPNARGNMHFFAGDWETAQKFLNIGFTLSFTGVITFTHDYDEVVRNTPLDMMLAETDAPYVTPAPFRGQRNEPMHVREVVKAIARIKNTDEESVRAQLMQNAHRVFGIKISTDWSARRA